MPEEPRLRIARKVPEQERHGKALIIWIMGVGTILAGLAFAYKVAEFIYTVSSEEARGFADVPVTVYFFVAAGWLCLFIWAYLSGKLSNLEEDKLYLLEQDDPEVQHVR